MGQKKKIFYSLENLKALQFYSRYFADAILAHAETEIKLSIYHKII